MGEGGGVTGGFSLARIFCRSLPGQNFFFNLSWSRKCFSLAIVGQNIVFYAIQIWKHLFDARCCLCVNIGACICTYAYIVIVIVMVVFISNYTFLQYMTQCYNG